MADEKELNDAGWLTIKKKGSKENIRFSLQYNRKYTFAKDKFTATTYDNFNSLAIAVRDRMVERWLLTQEGYHYTNPKRVYYLSMEFLIGRMLSNNAINLDLMEPVKGAIEELGLNLEDLLEEEHDAGLGNGGLGRLAACFLDSMATLGIPANGYGIRYDYGIFKQKIVNGEQVEQPDEWLKRGYPWEFVRTENAVRVKFYGHTVNEFKDGKLNINWTGTEDILAMPYDVPVAGYKNDVVNTLRLWSARSTEEFDLKHFNYGDYERAVYNKLTSENISKVLYPNDDFYKGRELRLKQEYFFTAASIADIVRRFKADNKNNLSIFPDKVAIQLNDTHPALAVAELMRVLMDQELLEWDAAWDIVTRTFAYTNHTVMPEALEKWSVTLLGTLLPRHLQIIYEINARMLKEVEKKFPGDLQRIIRMSLVE
ncbi:MAG: glycogen/starch/alpha-glucan family phosphorylase [Candidatus Firestonebacteria bacterium]